MERCGRIEKWSHAGASSFLNDGESDLNRETAEILQRRKEWGGRVF